MPSRGKKPSEGPEKEFLASFSWKFITKQEELDRYQHNDEKDEDD